MTKVRVRVSFAAQETLDLFWSWKKGRLPRLSDPPPVGADGSAGAVTAEDVRMVSQFRSMEGIVDSEKLSVLATCVISWVKEAILIRILAQEMAAAGIEGFELMWFMGSMVLLSFLDVESRGSLFSKDVWSAWFARLEVWSTLVMHESHRAWISISSLRIHLWLESTFHNIAEL
ncbi:hypothetical protein V6N11_019337 [Hibiscus sabdariffa]|uniref:Uncharacterized protein n=1 Tax=Hibiscus sabdariffa TaxID=183260 RepID=A0ABR2R2A7_9ROSI